MSHRPNQKGKPVASQPPPLPHYMFDPCHEVPILVVRELTGETADAVLRKFFNLERPK